MNIINQVEIVEQVPNTLAIIVGIVFFAGIILTILAMFSYGFDNGYGPMFLIAAFMVMSFDASLVIHKPALYKDEPTGRYRYECTIDKSVSFLELTEKYDVVEQYGDIYVLEDKESEQK